MTFRGSFAASATSMPSDTWRMIRYALSRGSELVVAVVALLVLAEVERVLALADVVVVGADPRQERICADLPRRRLHELPDEMALWYVPGAWTMRSLSTGWLKLASLSSSMSVT